MKIHEFISTFPDEHSCRMHFKELRQSEEILCKKCGGTEHYWLQAKWQWQCKSCRFRTTLRSGTHLQHARLPIRKWYLCIALMSTFKKGISAKEMQRQLQHSKYRTIWVLMQKIRHSLSLDESNMRAQIRTFLLQQEEERSNFQFNHLTLELKFSNRTFDKTDCPGMYVAKAKFVHEGKRSFPKLNQCYDAYFQRSNHLGKQNTKKDWSTIVRSNFNRLLTGIHHRVSIYYLQNYLDEFAFKYNNRNKKKSFFDLFLQTLIHGSDTYIPEQLFWEDF